MRHPWLQYPIENNRPGPQATQFRGRVCWIVPSSNRLDYGWRHETRCFVTPEEAEQVARQPMGIAKQVRADELIWTDGRLSVKQLYTRKNPNYSKRSK
jgi:hypothetical protein